MPPDTLTDRTPSTGWHNLPLVRVLPQAWRGPLVLLAVALAILILVTVREWGEMAHQWWNIDTYNHILLVPPIIAWLVWLKAGELARITPRPCLWGLGIIAGALALWLAGRVSGINLIAHAGAVGAVQGAVIAILGARVAVLLALPLGYLAFLVPFGDEIIAPLQAITAEMAITLTLWSGVPAVIDGIHIDTPAGLFIVAEECSGVKFLIAMVTLAVLVGFTRMTCWNRRALFLLAAIIVPVLANGVRAWGTIYIAQFAGVEFAAGFDHIVYGWVFFAIVVAVVLAGAWPFFEREPEQYGYRAADLGHVGWLERAEAGSPSARMVLAAMAAPALGAAILAALTQA